MYLDQIGPDVYVGNNLRAAVIKTDEMMDRIQKLEDIDRHCDNKEKFKTLLNELIDFEEGFTKS